MKISHEKEKEIEREIKVLDLFHDFYDFEQNHTLNDWMPRIVVTYTTGVALAIAFMYFGYWYVALLIFFIEIVDSYRHFKALNKKREKIKSKKQQIRTNILNRYNLLGINTHKFINEFEWEEEIKSRKK